MFNDFSYTNQRKINKNFITNWMNSYHNSSKFRTKKYSVCKKEVCCYFQQQGQESTFNSSKKKNPRENCEYYRDRCWIKLLKTDLNFLCLIDLIAGVFKHFSSKTSLIL